MHKTGLSRVLLSFVGLIALVSIAVPKAVAEGGQERTVQRTSGMEERIVAKPGFNFWSTIRAVQRIRVPGNALGRDTDAFDEDVVFIGEPLPSPIGDTDTIMYREEPLVVGKPIRTRLVAFSNVSAAPIEIRGKGRQAGFYEVHVTLSSAKESTGTLTITSAEGSRGNLEGTLTLYPRFEFRPIDGGEAIVLDSGKTDLPGLPLKVSSRGGAWSLRAEDVKDHPAPFLTNGFFYTSVVNIEYFVGDERLGACAKRTARISLPSPLLEGAGRM